MFFFLFSKMHKRSHSTQSAVNSLFKKKTRTRTTPAPPIVLDENQTPPSTPGVPPPLSKDVKRCGKFDSLEKRLKYLGKYKDEGSWKKHRLLEWKLGFHLNMFHRVEKLRFFIFPHLGWLITLLNRSASLAVPPVSMCCRRKCKVN